MSDIAESLLVQYYGFPEKSETGKFLSIHECASSTENDADKLIEEQSTIDTNGDNTSREMEVQRNDIKNEERNSKDYTPARSSRALEWEELENDDDASVGFDIIFGADTMGDLYNNTNVPSGKGTQNIAVHSRKTISTNPGLGDNEGNDLYLSLGEDASPDSVSDISLVVEKKKSKESRNTSPTFTPLINKTPVYNETFIDLTSAGLISVPIEIVKEYPTIRMLYLENNSLSELPDNVFSFLPHLHWLDVRNNQLTSLPTSIKSHPSLETILLQGNKIEKLPLELCFVSKLKILNILHNPIVTPPKDIIALGCSSILNYLRIEWNKLHPDEPVTFVEQEIEPKPSTIFCSRKKQRKLPSIPRKTSKSMNDIGTSFKAVSTMKKSRAYKPSNRCDSKGIDITMQQRLHCISKARDLLNAQSTAIQRIKNTDTIKEWRRSKRSFSKSMEKVSKRNEDDIPFAIDIENYPAIQRRPQKKENYSDNQKMGELKFASSAHINKKIQEIMGSLQQFKITKSSDILTPKSKQKYLQNEIEKLSYFQKEVQRLRRYNEVNAPTPINSPNTSS